MRFSLSPNLDRPWHDLLERVRWAEQVGWDGVWLADHLLADGGDVPPRPLLEAWTTLAALMAVVPRLRIGTLVSANTLRHPSLVAKMAATLDHIGDGRFVLGLGAGGDDAEHAAFGIPFPDIGERLSRLDEAARLLRLLFDQPSTTFAGKHYCLNGAALMPRPRALRLLIGGAGERRALAIVARWADEWCIWGTPEEMVAKTRILDRHCAAVGRDPREIHRAAQVALFVHDDEALLARARANDLAPAAVIGTVEEVATAVGRYRDAGIGEIVVNDVELGPAPESRRSLELFAADVLPRFVE